MTSALRKVELFLLAISAYVLLVAVTHCRCTVRDGHIDFLPGVKIVGERYTSAKDPKIFGYAYYGLRYGTAKRFEASKRNIDYSYLRNSPRKQGFACPQRPFPMGPPKVYNEDCLYLDVYVPPIPSKNRNISLPVLMWIHGGALQIDSKDGYNSSALAEEIDAIVVTINYRLSVFGFLSTGDSAAKGNYGLGDCKLAVNWIQKHINVFGGNPHAITIAGESAGGFLTSAMLLDRAVRSSIRASISMSGTVLTELAFIPEPKKVAVEFAGAVGCSTTVSEDLITCLKGLPVDKLLAGAKGFDMGNPVITPYGFVVDGIHITDIPHKAVETAARNASNGPGIVMGYLSEDASALFQIINPDIFDAKNPLDVTKVIDIIAKQLLPNGGIATCPEPNYKLAETVVKYYNIQDTDTRPSLLLKLFHVATDSVFAYPAVKQVEVFGNNRNSSGPHTQLYRISFDPKYNMLGAFHQFDVASMFFPAEQMPGLKIDARVVKSIRQMLFQLVHQGRINGPRYGKTGQYVELDQSTSWQTGKVDHRPMVNFWDQVITSHNAYTLECRKAHSAK